MAYLVNNSTDYACIDGSQSVLELPTIVGKPPSRLASRGEGARPVTSQSQRFSLRSRGAGLVTPKTTYNQRVASSYGHPTISMPRPSSHGGAMHPATLPPPRTPAPLHEMFDDPDHPDHFRNPPSLVSSIKPPPAALPPPTPEERRRSLVRACTPGSVLPPRFATITSENLKMLPHHNIDEVILRDRERRSYQSSRYSGSSRSKGSEPSQWTGGWGARRSTSSEARPKAGNNPRPVYREEDEDGGLDDVVEEEKTPQQLEAANNSLLDKLEEFDANGDGIITFEEFKKACTKFGKIYSNSKMKHLFRQIDKDDSGTIEISEFMTSDLMKWDKSDPAKLNSLNPKTYGGGMGLSNQTSDERAMQIRKDLQNMKDSGEAGAELAMAMARSKLQGHMKTNGAQLAKAFKFFDEDNSGALTRKEFKAAIQYMKIPVKSAVLDQMLDACDNSGDGLIDYQEFVKIIGGEQNIHKPVQTSCL